MLAMINTTTPIDVLTAIAIIESLISERPDAAVIAEFDFEPKFELMVGLRLRLKLVDLTSVVDRAVVRKRAENGDPST